MKKINKRHIIGKFALHLRNVKYFEIFHLKNLIKIEESVSVWNYIMIHRLHVIVLFYFQGEKATVQETRMARGINGFPSMPILPVVEREELVPGPLIRIPKMRGGPRVRYYIIRLTKHTHLPYLRRKENGCCARLLGKS